MNSPPDSHARHVLTMYTRETAGSTGDWDLLLRLIAEQIHKAVSEDRETLREQFAVRRARTLRLRQRLRAPQGARGRDSREPARRPLTARV